MKLLLLIFCVCGAYSAKSEEFEFDFQSFLFAMHNCDLRYIEQPLDHFNIFDNRTWKMRYLVRDTYFEPGGPLFVEIGGESVMDDYLIMNGQLPKLAEKHKGMLVHTEHRYYGKSLPFGTNFSTPNMRWLTSDQGLEDLIRVIEYVKETIPGLKDSKVVVHGCSYPGMLATWVRIKYPHIVDMAYASSAPLEIGVEYPGYYEVVNDVYANVTTQCIETIKSGFRELKLMIQTKDGLSKIRKALRKWSCGNVYKMSAPLIFARMMNLMNIQGDQMEYEQLSCLALTMDSDDTPPYERLCKMMVIKSRDKCYQPIPDSDEATEPTTEEEPSTEETQTEGGGTEGEEEAPEEEADVDLDSMAWGYQSCTEQAAFPTMNKNSTKNFIGEDSPIDDFINNCMEQFGPEVNRAALERSVKSINRRFGARHPVMTKVLTVQGTHDPWREFGLMESPGPEAPVILIDGQHCVDVYEHAEYDPPQLIKGRRDARNIITTWLNEIQT